MLPAKTLKWGLRYKFNKNKMTFKISGVKQNKKNDTKNRSLVPFMGMVYIQLKIEN